MSGYLNEDLARNFITETIDNTKLILDVEK